MTVEFTQGRLVDTPDAPFTDEEIERDESCLDSPLWMAFFDEYERAKRVPCVTCGELPTREGHDACIANLPGVLFACCGHGVLEPEVRRSHCYLVFDDGLTLYDAAAHAAMEMLGGQPAPIPDVRKRVVNHGVKFAGEEWVRLIKEGCP